MSESSNRAARFGLIVILVALIVVFVAAMISAFPNSEVTIGEWHDKASDSWDAKIKIVKNGAELVCVTSFKDGSTVRRVLEEVTPRPEAGRTFRVVDSAHGDSYVINAKRNLDLFDSNGFIREAQTVSGPPVKQSNATSADRGSKRKATAVDELVYIEQQKDAIKGKLRDPDSAEFRNVKVCYAMGPIVVGEVNSNNGFGGKAGFQRFVSGGKIQVLEEEMEPGAMDKVWASVCP